jgi:hypothetical protein
VACHLKKGPVPDPLGAVDRAIQAAVHARDCIIQNPHPPEEEGRATGGAKGPG